MKSKIIFGKKYYFIFFLTSLFLVIMWFHSGKILAGGEEGMPFYNPLLTLKLFSSGWYSTGTGYPTPVFIPRFLLFFTLSHLFKIGISSLFLQALTFFTLLFSGLYSCFIFVKNIFPKKEKIAFFASLFYLFNLYSMSQIWGRFLLTNIFAWAYFPLFLFLWLKIVVERKIKWVVSLVISSFVYSFTYGMPAMIITLWTPALILFVFEFIKLKSDRRNIFSACLISIFIWVIVNAWWLYPYLRLSSSSFTVVDSLKSNMDSLISVSQFFTTPTIALLRQDFLFGAGSLWYGFYSNPLIVILSITIFVFTLIGIWASRREVYWKYIFIVLLIGWFVSKGSNPSYGDTFFGLLFRLIPFTQALRNPYEKFGLVLLLPYAIFFGYGLIYLVDKFKTKFRSILMALTVLFFVFLVWPFWTGSIFNNLSVKVPNEYLKINSILKSRKNSERIVILPLIPGDSVTLAWGYSGIEPSEFIFDKESISKIVRSQYFDEEYDNLYKNFTSNKNYQIYFNRLNIGYILLHEDLDEKSAGASDSAEVKKILVGNSKINLIVKSGSLSLYKYNNLDDLITTDNKKTEIKYVREDSTHYKLYVFNQLPSFNLIFKETYNPLWQAQIGNNILKSHKIVYGYANSWEIRKQGTYTIKIVFKVWPWD